MIESARKERNSIEFHLEGLPETWPFCPRNGHFIDSFRATPSRVWTPNPSGVWCGVCVARVYLFRARARAVAIAYSYLSPFIG